jgi:hypothetical protein
VSIPKASLPDRRRLVRAQARERRARASIAKIRRHAAEGKLVLYDEYKAEQIDRIVTTKLTILRGDVEVASRCHGTPERARAALVRYLAPVLLLDWAAPYRKKTNPQMEIADVTT